MASSALSPFCWPEEDPFLPLESSLRCIERILQGSQGKPLRRTWIEHAYGEEEITLLEEEVPPWWTGQTGRTTFLTVGAMGDPFRRRTSALTAWLVRRIARFHQAPW